MHYFCIKFSKFFWGLSDPTPSAPMAPRPYVSTPSASPAPPIGKFCIRHCCYPPVINVIMLSIEEQGAKNLQTTTAPHFSPLPIFNFIKSGSQLQ